MGELLNKMMDNLIQEAVDDETFDYSGTWESTIHVLKAYIVHLKGQIPKWQPIETAPRDGSEIIICYQDHFTDIGSYSHSGECWVDKNSFRIHRESHWMPLSKLPKES